MNFHKIQWLLSKNFWSVSLRKNWKILFKSNLRIINREEHLRNLWELLWGWFPGDSDGKESACNAGGLGSIHGSGRSPGEGTGNPLQYICLENPMDGGAWWATVQFSTGAQSCPTLCDPMNCSMPGLLVHQQLPEFTQTHVHRVGDAIQPSHPLSSTSALAPNPSQHQSLFQWVNSLHEVAKVLEFQL